MMRAAALSLAAALSSAILLHARDAEACLYSQHETYADYSIPTFCSWTTPPTTHHMVIRSRAFNCRDGSFAYETGFERVCPNYPSDAAKLLEKCNGCLSNVGCESPTCASVPPDDHGCENCDGTDHDGSSPVDEGCGHDENGCSSENHDEYPIEMGSGRVETVPLNVFSVPGSADMGLSFELYYNSHTVRRPAQRTTIGNVTDVGPTIHGVDEDTHAISRGWLDNYSDRLVIQTFRSIPQKVTWIRPNGTVTFDQVGTGHYHSFTGLYELIDRGPPPPQDPSYARWVVRSRDTSKTRKIWVFQEVSYTGYAFTSYKIGRLVRSAAGSGSADLVGYYGYDVAWTPEGTISTVTDTFGRQLQFVYSVDAVGGITYRRNLAIVRYQASSSASPVDVAWLSYTPDSGKLLDRVERPGVAGYTRYRYWTPPQDCRDCGAALTDVIIAGPLTASTPAPQAPAQSHEIVTEHHVFKSAPFGGRPIAIGSSGPRRAYAYLRNMTSGEVKQLDLHMPTGQACVQGACQPSDVAGCWSSSEGGDDQCYASTVLRFGSYSAVPSGARPDDADASLRIGTVVCRHRRQLCQRPAQGSGRPRRSALDLRIRLDRAPALHRARR